MQKKYRITEKHRNTQKYIKLTTQNKFLFPNFFRYVCENKLT